MATHREGISPKDFAAAIGVSESSVKRWVDQGLLRAIRTAGGHRRIAPDEAARWIREHRVQPVKPERIGFVAEPPDGADALRAHVETFYEHLHAGRAEDARSMTLRLFLAGHAIAAIADALIAPALGRIGSLWQHGEEGVFLEHRATDIAVHVVKDLDGASIDQRPRKKGPAALSLALEDDHYALPPMLCAATLGEVGFRPTNLGPNTPISVAELAVERLGARLVCVSVSVVPPPRVVSETAALVQRLRGKGVRVAVGGRHVDTLGLLATSDGPFVGASMTALATWARGFVGAS
ncbi:MAG: helix-turn-helix domain-containing protein [Deltaproteobacteria bacterium]|nr:helix-turn-helix domain-containing protein [Deltaproteobacteria bacterium]